MRKRSWYEFTTKSLNHKNKLCNTLDNQLPFISYTLSYIFETRTWNFTILMNKEERKILDKFVDLCLNNNVLVRGGIFDLG